MVHLVFPVFYPAVCHCGHFGFIRPELVQTISSVMLIPSLIGMILVIVLRAVGGKDTFAGVGMGGGKAKLWFLFGLGIIVICGIANFIELAV